MTTLHVFTCLYHCNLSSNYPNTPETAVVLALPVHPVCAGKVLLITFSTKLSQMVSLQILVLRKPLFDMCQYLI